MLVFLFEVSDAQARLMFQVSHNRKWPHMWRLCLTLHTKSGIIIMSMKNWECEYQPSHKSSLKFYIYIYLKQSSYISTEGSLGMCTGWPISKQVRCMLGNSTGLVSPEIKRQRVKKSNWWMNYVTRSWCSVSQPTTPRLRSSWFWSSE